MERIPYCGAPPLPGAVPWNLDPVLMLALLALPALAAWRGARPLPALAGTGVLALALLSPLCALAVTLFSARVGQHMLVLLLAAPLLAWGWRGRAPSLSLASGLMAAALWLWHLPGPYGWSFDSHAAWWAMHASLLLAALWFWRAAFAARAEAALMAGLATAAQMGALGALLTFAPRALYPVHAGTTWPWGLSPLEDQQLGGLLMWVPGGVLFAALAVLAMLRTLRAA